MKLKQIILIFVFLLFITYNFRDSSYLYFGPTYDNVLKPGRNSISIEHDGINRTFWVETPLSYSSNHKYPVVVYFHVFGSSGTGTSMLEMINNENFIGIYPDGINNSWNSGVISYDENQSQADDYGFTIKMIDWIKTNTRIDENRIFAFGQSAGAMFLYEQVVSRQHDFAAIAIVMGNYFDCDLSSVKIERCIDERPILYPNQPVSILHIHGQMDNLVPFNGGPAGQSDDLYVKSVYDTITTISGSSLCNFEPRIDTFSNGVTRYKYYGCNNFREIVVYAVYSAGHGNFNEYLPSGLIGDGVITLVWDFFENNPKNKFFDLNL